MSWAASSGRSRVSRPLPVGAARLRRASSPSAAACSPGCRCGVGADGQDPRPGGRGAGRSARRASRGSPRSRSRRRTPSPGAVDEHVDQVTGDQQAGHAATSGRPRWCRRRGSSSRRWVKPTTAPSAGSTNMPSTSTWLAARLFRATLPGDLVEVGDRGGGEELPGDLVLDDPALLDGLLAGRALGDVRPDDQHRHALGVLVCPVLDAADVLQHDECGDAAHRDRRDEDHGSARAHVRPLCVVAPVAGGARRCPSLGRPN